MKNYTNACAKLAFVPNFNALITSVLKEFLGAEAIAFKLVPPAVHCCNAAYLAIRTFQNHFIAGL
jgi:hypothetical protein